MANSPFLPLGFPITLATHPLTMDKHLPDTQVDLDGDKQKKEEEHNEYNSQRIGKHDSVFFESFRNSPSGKGMFNAFHTHLGLALDGFRNDVMDHHGTHHQHETHKEKRKIEVENSQQAS